MSKDVKFLGMALEHLALAFSISRAILLSSVTVVELLLPRIVKSCSLTLEN